MNDTPNKSLIQPWSIIVVPQLSLWPLYKHIFPHNRFRIQQINHHHRIKRAYLRRAINKWNIAKANKWLISFLIRFHDSAMVTSAYENEI